MIGASSCKRDFPRILHAFLIVIMIHFFACAVFAADDKSEQIKVGVIVSHFTATGPSFNPEPYGYAHAEVARIFLQAGHEVAAIIEPGTENDDALREVLKELELAGKWLHGTDIEALKGLDVIVSGSNQNMRAEVVAAIVDAVKSGVNFLNFDAFGTVSGHNEHIEELLGIGEARSHWRAQPLPCEVVESHPLLMGLEKGAEFTVPGMDAWPGNVDGTPLLLPVEEIRNSTSPSGTVCPLYIRNLGNGKVLNCQWWGDIAETEAPISSNDFYLRCVRWLAKPDTELSPVRKPAEPKPASFSSAKVGIIVSHFTATGPHWVANPYGFKHAKIAIPLRAAGYTVIAVLDPETEELPEVKAALQEYGFLDGWVDGSDPDELSRLAVIVSGRLNANMRPDVIDAITEAVHRGTMFFNANSFSTVEPGYADECIEPLLGLKSRKYFWHPAPMTWKVVEEHPLLEGYKEGDRITGFGMNGIGGVNHGTVLVQADLERSETAQGFGGGLPSEQICPIYIHQLGRGTTLHFLFFGNNQSEDRPFSHDEFYVRGVEWLISQRPKPKVGIIASYSTEERGYGWASRGPYGHVEYVLESLGVDMNSEGSVPTSSDYDFYAIIEPGTENNQMQLDALMRLGLFGREIAAGEKDKLCELDLIVSGRNQCIHPSLLKGLRVTVEQGVPLLNLHHFANRYPGYTEDVEALMGLRNGQYYYHPQPMKMETLKVHPLLYGLKEDGGWLSAGMNGWAGTYDGEVLLQGVQPIPEQDRFFGSGNMRVDSRLNPLYIHRLKKGTVVNVQIWNWGNILFGQKQFMKRCADWLIAESKGQNREQ